MDDARVVVLADGQGWATSVAGCVTDVLSRALSERSRARLVLAGGSTPIALYEQLSKLHAADVDWTRVDFYQGDERAVDPEDPASNFASVRDCLLKPLGITGRQVRRIRGELPVVEAAAEYDRVIATELESGSWDLTLLGVGDDGHTASLFPGEMRADSRSWAIATRAPVAPHDRVSMSLRALNRSRNVFFLVCGPSKAVVAQRVLQGDSRLPAGQIEPQGSPPRWFLDCSAAAELRPSGDVQSVGTE